MNFGKSIVNFQHQQNSSIGTFDRIVSALPQPKRPGTTKKKEGEAGAPAGAKEGEKGKAATGLPGINPPGSVKLP